MNELPRTLPAFCWHFIKIRPIAFTVFFLTPLLVVLEAVVMPYALKLVIDAFGRHEQSRDTIMQSIAPALWLGGGAWMMLIVGARLQEWWQVYVMPLFALIVGLWIIADLWISYAFVRYINLAARENAEDKSQLSGRIVDSITNVIATKLFAKRAHELAYIQQAQNSEIKSNTLLKWRIMVYRFFVDWPVTVMWVLT